MEILLFHIVNPGYLILIRFIILGNYDKYVRNKSMISANNISFTIPRDENGMFYPLTPNGPQNLTTFAYGGFVDMWIREMDSSAFSPFLLTVGGQKRTGK
ncbi:hypothetical protein AVEN_84677-1 [Araneus ventricosus]|uniref:Uncharacterized protein n=1 Tax=Araneus ventricosus TaxID=182803 RepID=A0A4Y2SKD2_ARAVE|nr:hypothetical protein AVEN_84677-1 [Araneus ventricosus]